MLMGTSLVLQIFDRKKYWTYLHCDSILVSEIREKVTVTAIHPVGNVSVNVCTKVYDICQTSVWDISVWTKTMDWPNYLSLPFVEPESVACIVWIKKKRKRTMSLPGTVVSTANLYAVLDIDRRWKWRTQTSHQLHFSCAYTTILPIF